MADENDSDHPDHYLLACRGIFRWSILPSPILSSVRCFRYQGWCPDASLLFGMRLDVRRFWGARIPHWTVSFCHVGGIPHLYARHGLDDHAR